ncbi:unnamed protein product [Symbiodinium sp. CCMP2456]|nr:unnamed protein product [Symbiodinium sp. CCMP2456]
MEAVPPPAGVGIASPTTLSHNSDEGHGNTLMAGGDLDGDLVQVSFNEKLIALMRATQAAVERLAPLRWRLEADVIDSMTEPATGWENGGAEARGHSPECCPFRFCCGG